VLFGGQGIATMDSRMLNDVLEFTPSSYDVSIPPNYIGSYTQLGSWTAVARTTLVNQGGTYGHRILRAESRVAVGGGKLHGFVGQRVGFRAGIRRQRNSLGLLNDLWNTI